MGDFARIEFDEVDTALISVTSDADTMKLHVTWCVKENGEWRYPVRCIGLAFFANPENRNVATLLMVTVRERLHNLLDYHLKGGLELSHDLIRAIQARKQHSFDFR
jgi:hypothetical protein